MMERLFDIVAERAAADPNAEMLAAKENGQWKTYSCKTVWETAQKLCGGLLTLGIKNQTLEPEAQEKIAIISFNRPEWMMVDLGVQMTGAVLTPIYPTISPNELAHIFKEAEVKIVFVSNAELYGRFKDAFAEVPTLQHVFSFDPTENVPSWNTLIEKNAPMDQSVIDRIKPETLATIIYTSGTTGDPKGVMLSHHNIVSNVSDSMPAFTFAEKGSRALSFLPLNHIFERMVTYIYLHAGVAVWYAESMDTIGVNLKEVKPLVFTVVPRLLEKVYERIMATGIELTGIKRALFFWALELGKKFDNVNHGSAWYRFQLAIANKLVFNKWREALGGNVKAVVNGSAALQERLIRIFTAANVIVMEGYGLTETSPVVSVNRYESENRRVGTVGPLINNVEVKIAEDGEILTKGPNIMMGYYKKPELTAEAMKDGWFHTGDIGEWQEGRFLKITDRKKEIFKTSGGKYVAPQMIENKLRESPFIEQMMVIGNSRKFVSALIVPNFGQVKKTLHISESDNSKVIKMPEVIALIQKQLDKYNPLFSHPEQVKKFELLPDEWTIDAGELTPSLKIKRKFVEQKYSKVVEGMYGE
ncbi:AMP-dependent synthetase/ligase [Taibaiella soli]|uniref:Long-chain fatty acid--CoA ligase n=1 Tax=Taibaiella soli TaxID=1649169 RepID=A0A2W2B049_9BACT|nr:long-chain fatty acid--CoA ligase [Taibaiella soli]PZF73348.1 long-chain fatty acid--CoA ligase [Taibaiella soli]